MLYTIRSGCMQAQISSLGAQLMHLTGKTEYLWQGDPAYWTDRAPTIFPYVARLTNGIYRYEGQTYHLPIHGFAPTAEFTAAQKTDDAVALQIETDPELYAQYPFRFRYTICYRLEENTLHAEICVENRDEKRMYFALGGHPGINVPLEDGLRF